MLGAGSGNGIDVEHYAELPTRADARVRLDITSDAHVVGFVGRLTRDKGIVDLIECENKTIPSVYFLKTDSIRLFDGIDPPPSRGDLLWIKRVENKKRMHVFEMAIKRVSEEEEPF